MIQILSTDWSQAWTITGLGVGMVFCILVLLVVILIIFNKLSAKADAKAPQQTNAIQAAKRQTGDAATISEAMGHDEVAIATALYMYFNDMHDNESGVLTINHNNDNSGWHYQLGN